MGTIIAALILGIMVSNTDTLGTSNAHTNPIVKNYTQGDK